MHLGTFWSEREWIAFIYETVILSLSCKPHKTEGINVIFDLMLKEVSNAYKIM
jgi:hypothetical protein